MIHGEITLRNLLNAIERFLRQPGVTELVINRPGEIGVERNGQWEWHDIDLDFDTLDSIGILTGQLMAKEFDPQRPICLATLPTGERFTAIRQPVTAPGIISITIRVPSQKTRTVHDDDFLPLLEGVNKPDSEDVRRDQELLDLYRAGNWAPFFKLAVERRKTILATGATGSGKTTFLKRLLHAIGLEERVITVEDTAEFGVMPQRNRGALFYGTAGITAGDCVEAALRMRPDRILMQELRGAEAFGFIRALLAGHPGGMTTLHAEKGEDEAFEALAVMVKQHPAGREIPDDKLRTLIRRLIDIVVWCERDESGKYKAPFIYYRDAMKDQKNALIAAC